MVPVAIIHDDVQDITSLHSFIQSESCFFITGIYCCTHDAIKGLSENPADIIVLDMYNAHGGAMETMRTVKTKFPFTKWLVYTSCADDETIISALHSGANGYILKDGRNAFINALHELVNGGAPMSPGIIISLLAYFRKLPKKENHQNVLSEREKEILHFTSRGLLYKEIGHKLGIQRETVKKHLAKIYDKLEVQNKIEAFNKFYGL